MRVVFMGSPEFAVPSLQYLLADGYQVATVFTQPDKPAGRGRAPVASPVKQAALALGLPVWQPAGMKAPEVIAQLAGLKPEVIVVAAFGQILPQKVLDIPPRGCLNVHPSLLPRYRGAAPIPAAILAGDSFAGVSIMLLDKGMDTGPVLVRGAVSISERDTTGSLTAKLATVGARLLTETLTRWQRGEIKPQPQNDAEASYTRPFTKEDGVIDWHLPAIEIERRVRALNPWPGCYTAWQGRQLKIIEAVPLSGENAASPGTVIAPAKGAAFGIGTGEGVLGVVQLQQEGKRAVSAADFLNGHRDIVGATLPG